MHHHFHPANGKVFPLAVLTVFLVAIGQVQAAQIPALKTPAAALAFTLKDLDGKARTLAEFRGKVVAINLWATWCPPCRAEMPSMQRAYDRFKADGFVILAVNVGEDWDAVASFIEDMGASYPVLLDPTTIVAQKYRALGLPTTFIIGRDGRLSHRINGGRDWDDSGFQSELKAIIDR